MTVLREIIAHFGVSADDTALRRLDTTIDRVKGALGTLGVALGASQLINFVQNAAAAADDLGDTAERLNISTAALQEWGYAAKLSGSSAEEFQGSISHLVRTLSEAGEGGDEQQKTLRKLGVAYKDAEGHLRGVDDLLPEIADGIAKIDNPTERAALAMKVFGRGAQPLVPLLARGAAGVEKLRQEFRDLGGGLSDETVKKASDYADQLDRFNVVMQSLKSKALDLFLPTFQRVSELLIRGGQIISNIATNTYVFETALAALAVTAAVYGATWVAANTAVLASMLPLLGKVALLAVAFLAIEDVISFFSGGDSVLGDFLAEVTGLAKPVDAVREMFSDMAIFINNSVNGVKDLLKYIPGLNDLLGLDKSHDYSADDARYSSDQTRREGERKTRETQGRGAVAAGDEKAFQSARLPGESEDDAHKRFLSERQKYVQANPDAANEKDISAGFVSKTVSAPKKGKGGAGVNNNTNISITVPPGTAPEQAEHIRKTVAEEMDKRDRRTHAAVAEEAA